MPVLFALGLRPFFLLASIAAVISVATWVPAFVGAFALNTYYGQIGWHSHEMIFGFTCAVIAGFLLTAVRNWTELPTPQSGTLAGLAILWCLGRVLPLFPAILPGWLIAVVDLAFLPAVAFGIGVPLVRHGETRNLIFLPLMAAICAANLLVHLELLGYAANSARRGIFLGLYLVVLLIVIMGGRVIPFFTERALQGHVAKRWRIVEWLSPLSVMGFLIAELFRPDSLIGGLFAALAALVNGIRLIGWYTNRFWGVPLLWVLHLGYGWIIAGFCLKAAAAFGVVPSQFTVHAFTVGAIGVLTLGMMSRVSLGHTGRPLKVGLSLAVAFGLVNAAAIVRGLLPVFFPLWLPQLVIISGALWVGAFLIFVLIYTPILTQPRIDNRPG